MNEQVRVLNSPYILPNYRLIMNTYIKITIKVNNKSLIKVFIN